MTAKALLQKAEMRQLRRRPEFAVAPASHLGESTTFTHASSRTPCAPPASHNLAVPPVLQRPLAHEDVPASASKQQRYNMSDKNTSGESPATPVTAPAPASSAAPASESAPIGSFGNARGSGLSRGKRATPAPAAPAASSASPTGYKPTAVEVITHQREYKNPFAPETPAPVNEPAPQAAPVENTDIPVANAPVTGASEPSPATAPAAGEPVAPPAEVIQPSVEKAEIKILPPAEAKRPAVSWGEGTHQEDTRTTPSDTRPTFRPERSQRGERGERSERRDPRAFEPRDSGKPQDTRFPRREPSLEQRGPLPREAREPRSQPAQKSGGFIGWLKGLFGAKPAASSTSSHQARDGQSRDGQPHDGENRQHRRRHRGGRGRGGYQGPRDGQPRDQQAGDQGFRSGEGQGQGERRYDGGGRRRRRGGRGRYRDDRGGGPSAEGQQGGGAI